MQKRTKFIIGVSLVVSAISTMFTFIALCAKKKNAWAAFTSIAAIEGLAGLLLIENEPINRKIQERRRAKAEVQEDIDELLDDDADLLDEDEADEADEADEDVAEEEDAEADDKADGEDTL